MTEPTNGKASLELYQGPGLAPTVSAPLGAHLPVRLNTLDDVMRLGTVLYESGFFRDVKGAAQAVVKILAGAEYGLGPIASMRAVHCFDGQTALHYSLIGGLIKQHPRYDYRVEQLTEQGCTLAFYDGPDKIGISTFDKSDGGKAGLLNKRNWKAHPKDMYFARALTRGARQFCPDVFSGPIYTPDELTDSTIHEDDGCEAEPEPQPVSKPLPAQPTASLKALQAHFSRLGFGAEDRDLRIGFTSALMGREVASFSDLSDEHKAWLIKRAGGIAEYLGSPEMVSSFASWHASDGRTIKTGEWLREALDAFIKVQATAVM